MSLKEIWWEIESFVLYLRRYRKPRIVAHPSWLGGRPRLDGTRLGVNWWAANRNQPKEWFDHWYDYIPLEHREFMFAVVDAVLHANDDTDDYEPWRAET